MFMHSSCYRTSVFLCGAIAQTLRGGAQGRGLGRYCFANTPAQHAYGAAREFASKLLYKKAIIPNKEEKKCIRKYRQTLSL